MYVYTYNRSEIHLIDEDENPETTIDTSYNYDTKEEDWIGKVELSVQIFITIVH